MEKLLDKGMPIDSEDENGDTALYWALSHGQYSFADKLIQRGAKLKHRNHFGVTIPENLAASKDKKLLDWLSNH